MVEIDGFLLGECAHVDQFDGGGVVEPKMALEHGMEFLPLGLAHCAVDGGGVDQERGGGEAIVVLREPSRRLSAAGQFRDKITQ